MKSITIIFAAFFFAFAFVAGNTAFAKDSTIVVSTRHKEPVQPVKLTSCNELNTFVAQCFALYNTSKDLRLQMETMFGSLATLQPSQVDAMLAQVKTSYTNMTSILPQVEALATTAPNMFSRVRSSLPIIEYPRALSNLAAAIKAVKFGVDDLKYMITNTIPSLKTLLGEKKKSAESSTSLAIDSVSNLTK